MSPFPLRLLPDSAELVDGQLQIGGCGLLDLAAEYGTPLFVYDEAQLRDRCREAVAVFGNGGDGCVRPFDGLELQQGAAPPGGVRRRRRRPSGRAPRDFRGPHPPRSLRIGSRHRRIPRLCSSLPIVRAGVLFFGCELRCVCVWHWLGLCRACSRYGRGVEEMQDPERRRRLVDFGGVWCREHGLCWSDVGVTGEVFNGA